MNKMGMIVTVVLFTIPTIVIAAESDSDSVVVGNQASRVAAYPQSEEGGESAAPVAQSDDAPDLISSASAESATDTAIAVKPAQVAPISSLLSKAVGALSQQVTGLQADLNQLKQQSDQTQRQMLEIQYALYGLAGLIVLMALLPVIRRRKSAAQVPTPAASVSASAAGSQGEYDFMGSSEAIPAKLDLARAYIAMEDFTSARDTLIEILTEGNENQRLEAKSLLTKIKS